MVKATKLEVAVRCEGKINLPLESLAEFQGNLKTMSSDNYIKFKAQLLELGFSEPVSVWQDKGKNYILNGHQRVKALLTMKKEGILVPPLIPCSLVMADTLKEAKKKVWALTSQYGEITREGAQAFAQDAGFVLEDVGNFVFPNIVLDAGIFIDGSYKKDFTDDADQFTDDNGQPLKKEKFWLFCTFENKKAYDEVQSVLCPNKGRKIDELKLRKLCTNSKKKS